MASSLDEERSAAQRSLKQSKGVCTSPAAHLTSASTTGRGLKHSSRVSTWRVSSAAARSGLLTASGRGLACSCGVGGADGGGSEVAQAVLHMHPAVTFALDCFNEANESATVSSSTHFDVAARPPPLQTSGVRRLVRSPGFCAVLWHSICEGDSEVLLGELRDVPEASRLGFGAR